MAAACVVAKEVRELCIFSPHSVIRDPPFSRVDLISCRNLLIYFGADVQRQVIPTFHYALRPDGYLFLGSAENVSQFGDLFAPIDKRLQDFRRRSDVAPAVRLPTDLTPALRSGLTPELPPRRAPLAGVALRQAVDEQVLERFSPPHVVVNHDGDVVYYSTRTGKYLEAPPGAPTRQLLTTARKGLRFDLRALLREAVEAGARPRGNAVVGAKAMTDACRWLNLTIGAARPTVAARGPLFLVLFADQGPALSRQETTEARHAPGTDATVQSSELRETRERLQSADRGVRDRAGGAEILERGAGLGQRGAAVDQSRSWRRRRRSCNRSTRNCTPSTPN